MTLPIFMIIFFYLWATFITYTVMRLFSKNFDGQFISLLFALIWPITNTIWLLSFFIEKLFYIINNTNSAFAQVYNFIFKSNLLYKYDLFLHCIYEKPLNGHAIDELDDIEVIKTEDGQRKILWKDRKVRTLEDCKNMDCPYPPYPNDFDENQEANK